MKYLDFIKQEMAVIMDRDPAIKTKMEVFLYPSFWALLKYRKAHKLYEKGHFYRARRLSQKTARKTGIEIHPGATIGEGLFIDHGHGVVIGETTIIGDNVTLYQGVTLGGTGKEQGKRHPTLGSNIMIGAGAKVLGSVTIGDNCKIGAGSVVVKDVPANSTVVGVPGRIVIRDNVRVETDLDQIHIPDPVMNEIEVHPVTSEEEAMEILEQTRKQYWDARHHCWAYIIGRNPAAERMSDDGEPAGTAGKPILEVIRGRELTNVLVIVTRYFGGTLLGTGGLVRDYTAATIEGLKNSESIARIHGVKLGIETNYTDFGKIQYLIANRNLDQLEPVYTDKVEMTVFVPTDEMGSLRAELMEGTNGQVVLDEETTCWFARTEDGIKIFDEE